jgi:serine/threonine-protein kinase
MELVPQKPEAPKPSIPKKTPKPLPREEPASWAPWIFTTLGVGVVGVGIGTYFGVRTVMKKNERDEVCPDAACSDDRGIELDEDARRSALASTISLTIGGAALATALILWLVEPVANTADARFLTRISF